MEIKGEMSMLNVLHLHGTDVNEIREKLEKKRDEVPAFFLNSPLIVDCSHIKEQLSALDLVALKQALIDLQFVPVGIRGMEPEQQAAVTESGWSVLRAGPKSAKSADVAESDIPEGEAASVATEGSEGDNAPQAESASQSQPTSDTAEIAPAARISRMFERPVRSGQQVFVEEGDAILLTHTSAGSEVMASGSIHVYGALRGRALAGVHGDTSARIFCRSLDAELVAIAGRYQLLDEGDTDLRGKPAMIRLSGEKLIIEPLE